MRTILVQFLHVCVQNIKKIIFKIWDMLEKIKRDVMDYFGFKNEKKLPIYFAKIALFSFLEQKVVYLRPVLSSSLFHEFWELNFM